MNIKPIASPHVAQPSGNNQQASNDARDRAIAKLTTQQPIPLENPQNISVEELGAIRAPSQYRQSDTNEGQEETESEVAEEIKSPPVSEDPQLSSKFAQLAKREKAIRIRHQQADHALKQREQALAAREAELSSKAQFDPTKYIDKQRLREQTLDVLAEEGLSYDELTQQLINQQPKNPRYDALVSKLEAKIEALEEANKTSQTNQQEQQTQAYDAAIKQLKTEATTLVSQDAAFELIRATGEVDQVVELIKSTFNEEGWVMSTEEAAAEVEQELERRMNHVINKTEKFKKRFATPVAPAKAAQTQSPNDTKQSQPMKTLTNATGSTRQLSARERALLAFRGELKS